MMAAVAAAWLSMLFAANPAIADKKVALVIGNAAYQNVVPLKYSAGDARAVAQMFRDAGFESVDVRTDLGNAEFRRALRIEAAAVLRHEVLGGGVKVDQAERVGLDPVR